MGRNSDDLVGGQRLKADTGLEWVLKELNPERQMGQTGNLYLLTEEIWTLSSTKQSCWFLRGCIKAAF